jgi:lipopolysaccharide transport system ATP-binding protein
MTPAIRVENIGKCYRVAHERQRGGRSFREAIADAVRAPFRRFMNGAEPSLAEDFWALKDVSFEVHPGEVVGIIGRNGAGKSTLLKILSRITKPTRGHVQLNGRVGSLLEVGTGFHPELTGRENVYLNGSILGMSRQEIDRKFDEIVAFAEIERFLDTPVKRYSSGMYVRLAFAVAAHLEPEVLIIDEVLAVGDGAFQKKCVGKLNDVAQSGLTVVFVSHSLDLVRRLCSRCLYLNAGRTASLGATDRVLSEYQRENPILLELNKPYSLTTLPRQTSTPGFVRFESVTLSSSNEQDNVLHPDQQLTVTITINALHHIRVNSLAILLCGPDKTKLFNADILTLGRSIELRAGPNTIEFSVRQLHLKPNRYNLGLWIANWPGVTYDYIDYAGELEILPEGDLIGPPSDGVVTCDFEMRILNNPRACDA